MLKDLIIDLVVFSLKSESCGLAVEHSAHGRRVVGSIPVQSNARVVSKPCQDRFLHPILVHYRK